MLTKKKLGDIGEEIYSELHNLRWHFEILTTTLAMAKGSHFFLFNRTDRSQEDVNHGEQVYRDHDADFQVSVTFLINICCTILLSQSFNSQTNEWGQ